MKTSKKLKPIPTFKTEDEEREFWATAELFDYFDSNDVILNPDIADLVSENSKTINISLSPSVFTELKSMAHKKGIHYKTLIQNVLSEKVSSEFKSK